MTSVDRYGGVSTSLAIKAPCRVATNANITLSGEQTVNGVAVVTDDRVFVKDQTDASENGIWVADTSSWTRAKDFDGQRDVATGTLIPVYSGSGTYFLYAVRNTGSIVIGTTELVFATVLS